MMNDEEPGSVVLNEENPWPGLHEFDERGRAFFNGRDSEIVELFRLLRDSSLTVLFGGSGLGKTSLLQAGLAPLLREENYLPVYIRLDPRDRNSPLLEQVVAAFRTQLESQGVDHPDFLPAQSLWEYLHRKDLELWSQHNELLTPVFMFDQFEELFTLGAENSGAVLELRDDLADLIENRVPAAIAHMLELSNSPLDHMELQARRYKILLSFREDFLPEIEAWRGVIPALMRSRLRLLPMNGAQAFKAVSRTGGQLVSEEIAKEIVRFVAAANIELKRSDPAFGDARSVKHPSQSNALEQLAIEPALLSLVCTGLNERRKAANKNHIDAELLRGTGRSIVTEFYEECVRELPVRVRRFIEDELITESGYRNSYPREDAIGRGLVTATELEDLVKSRLLRVEPQLGTDRIELIHDLLTAVVRKFRDQERLRQKQELESKKEIKQKRQLMIAGALVLVAIVLAASFWHLWISADRALKAYEEEKERRLSVEVSVERNKKIKIADQDRNHAINLATTKKYDDALLLLKKSLSVYRDFYEDQKVAITLVDIGKVYALQGHIQRAKEYYDRAYVKSVDIRNAAIEGLVFESRAALSEQLGNTEEALEQYRTAQSRYTVAGEGLQSARMLERLAVDAENLEKFEQAADLYRRARDSFVVAGDMLGVTRVEEALSRTVPWGILIDLKRGKFHPMHGERIMVGRDSPDFGVVNDVSFTDRLISRRHLIINHEHLQTDDQRSTNGTAVNARQIPYGEGVRLSDGDILTLANEEVLQFKTVKSEPSSPPPDAWGILVDGNARDYRYLTETEYAVTIREGKLVLASGAFATAMLKLRNTNGKVEMFDAEDEWRFVFSQRQACTEYESCYQYEKFVYPSGNWTDLITKPSMFAILSPDGSRIEEEGPSLQVILAD